LKLREILKGYLYFTASVEEIDSDTNLEEYGLDSFIYLRLVVAIENEFQIEFDDEALDFRNFSTIKSLASYIAEKSD
jgi:acyl carrier protein